MRSKIGMDKTAYAPEINPPTDKLVDIRLGMSLAPRVASTGLLASATVKTKLEAHVVNLVRDGLDAVGPL